MAYDVFHFLVASQANLYAALSWTLIHFFTKPVETVGPVVEEIQQLRRELG